MSQDISYALRLPKKLHAAMKRLARDDRRSLNFMIVEACEQMIARRIKVASR